MMASEMERTRKGKNGIPGMMAKIITMAETTQMATELREN